MFSLSYFTIPSSAIFLFDFSDRRRVDLDKSSHVGYTIYFGLGYRLTAPIWTVQVILDPVTAPIWTVVY